MNLKKGLLILVCILLATVLSGCGGNQHSASDHEKENIAQAPAPQTNGSASTPTQANEKPASDSGKTPPVIEHLDTYPFPVPTGWQEESFEVWEYEDGASWEAVFTFEGDAQEQAIAYKEVLDELGYEIQELFIEVFKIGTVEFAGIPYHGTFSFEVGDEYSEWGAGQGFVEITFSEKE